MNHDHIHTDHHTHKPFLTLPPIVVANENLPAIFAYCSREATGEGNKAFSEAQEEYAYPYANQLNETFKAGEVWKIADQEDHTSMITAFIDRKQKIQIMLQDNNPSLPQSVRGRNILLLTTGEHGFPPSFALLTKNPALAENFKRYFPNKQMVDSKFFAEPVYMPYGKIEPYMTHLLDGHVMGTTCVSCNRPGHQHDAFTPQGLGFGSDK